MQAGDSWASIAAQYDDYGVTMESIQQANPDVGVLLPGTTIVLPFAEGEVHYVLPGDQLLAIALRYDVSLDDLVEANTDVLDPNNRISFTRAHCCVFQAQMRSLVMIAACSRPETASSNILSRMASDSFAWPEKFDLSMTTILYANEDRIVGEGLTDGMQILIPPRDGAIYIVNENDVIAETSLEDLVLWYDVQNFDNITDWDGNPVQMPLEVGQRIFLSQADSLAGA